jgi:hypothetical protein
LLEASHPHGTDTHSILLLSWCSVSEEKSKGELEVKMNALATEAKSFKRERQRLEEQLVLAQVGDWRATLHWSQHRLHMQLHDKEIVKT